MSDDQEQKKESETIVPSDHRRGRSGVVGEIAFDPVADQAEAEKRHQALTEKEKDIGADVTQPDMRIKDVKPDSAAAVREYEFIRGIFADVMSDFMGGADKKSAADIKASIREKLFGAKKPKP